MPLNEMKAFVDEARFLSSNYPPGAGRKLETIYNKTLSLL